MKALLLAATLVAAGVIVFHNVVTKVEQTNIDDLWAQWKVQFERTYSESEEIIRKTIFSLNYAKVLAHNADTTQTFTMGLTQFADLTNEEFGEKIRCRPKSNEDGLNDPYCPGNTGNCPTLPATNETSWDWRSRGAVTAIKNQGDCGSCWAFSSTGSLEGLYKLNNNVLLSFSEQQLVDCASNCEACDGCFVSWALEYTAKAGIALESLYPYKGYQQSCKISGLKLLNVNTGYQCIKQKDEGQLLASVVQQPTSVDVEADQDAWQLYSGGIVTAQCGDSLDHAVLAVGFNTADNYLIIKNSWGTSWGEEGYIRIGLSTKANSGYGVCGILRCANKAVHSS